MKQKSFSRILRCAVLFSALALLGACATTVTETRRTQIMELKPELNPTRTWCIGRFLLDLPPTASILVDIEDHGRKFVSGEYGGGWKYWFADIEMPPEKMSFEAFEKKMQARQEELRKAVTEKGLKRLLQTEHSAKDIYVLATWGEKFKDNRKIIEGYRWSGGFSFLLKAEVADNKQAAGVERMQQRLSTLRARKMDEIPTEEGFCFPGGFIAGKLEHNEEMNIGIKFPEYQDLALSIHIFPTSISSKSLLERQSGVWQAIGAGVAGFRRLRSGDRPLAGFPGQESLITAPHEDSDGRAHLFTWEYVGRGTLQGPFIEFEFRTGSLRDYVSLSDEEAIALWDAILNSFRIRPVKPGKTSAITNEDFPRRVASGEKCPQTGHWRCAEDGETLLFHAGQVMPTANLSKPATGLMNWLKGRKEEYSHQGPGHWEWVEERTEQEAPKTPLAPDTPPPEQQG